MGFLFSPSPLGEKKQTSADPSDLLNSNMAARNCLLGQSLFTFQILVSDATAAYQATLTTLFGKFIQNAEYNTYRITIRTTNDKSQKGKTRTDNKSHARCLPCLKWSSTKWFKLHFEITIA